ncbi:MAG: SMC-Scp complex subunit ScpB [Candidatus Woesearchaeota archaeon]|nr:SMC-Scp complex subunit ScpB [Candidatus Woesearchaeota archaeon]
MKAQDSLGLDREVEIRKKVEALLFSSGRKMTASELAKLSHENEDSVRKSLESLKKDYDEKNASLIILNDGELYNMAVREKYLGFVRKIVPRTELNKTVLETLAVIAWKAPILQSDIIRIRTNKAYDHIDQLEEEGFVTKKRHSRSYLISLSQKFYEYFDLAGREELQKAFRKIEEDAEKSPQKKLQEMVGKLERYENSNTGEENKEGKPEIETYASDKKKSPVEQIAEKNSGEFEKKFNSLDEKEENEENEDEPSSESSTENPNDDSLIEKKEKKNEEKSPLEKETEKVADELFNTGAEKDSAEKKEEQNPDVDELFSEEDEGKKPEDKPEEKKKRRLEL